MELTGIIRLISRQCAACGRPETFFHNGKDQTIWWFPGRIISGQRCQGCGSGNLLPSEYRDYNTHPKPEYDPKLDKTLPSRRGRKPRGWNVLGQHPTVAPS